MVEIELFTLVPIIAGMIGIGVGIVSVWSMVNTMKRNQKLDMDESNKESETRMKEFINLKLMAVDGKIDAVKENVKDMDDRVHHRMKERDEFFTGWIQRMEDEIDTDRHNKTKQR